MKPTFPVISIYYDALEIVKDEAYLAKATVLGVLKKTPDVMVFDSAGTKWSFDITSNKVNNTFFTKILAYTFYNPIVDVSLHWRKLNQYPLEELKTVIYKCIDDDDDILTQFAEPDFLKERIRGSGTFEDIFNVLSKYIFEVDEEKLWQELDP